MNVSGTIEAILDPKERRFIPSRRTRRFTTRSVDGGKERRRAARDRRGEFVGILSERDYTRKVMLRGKRSRETLVREIMSTDLTTVDPRRAWMIACG